MTKTENNNKNVYFSPIDKKSLPIIINSFVSENDSLLVWKKNDSAKSDYQVEHYDEKSETLTLSKVRGSSNIKKNDIICFQFNLKGVFYFAKAKAEISSNFLKFNLENGVFKCERRKNFRLNTYPHYEVFCRLKLKKIEEEMTASSFQDKQSEVFASFLEEFGERDDNFLKDGIGRFRVRDISVTGLSFWVDQYKKNLFKKGMEFDDLTISFNDKDFSIPRAQLVYLLDLPKSKVYPESHKVALHFMGISEDLDTDLQKTILKKMRKIDQSEDFEKFIG